MNRDSDKITFLEFWKRKLVVKENGSAMSPLLPREKALPT